jgi:ankyrin repeat protein
MRSEEYQLAHRLLDIGAVPNLDCGTLWRKRSRIYYESPLLSAVRNQNVELVRQLLSHSAEVDARPPLGTLSSATAVQIAAINGNFEIFELLLQAVADMNAPPGINGRTALEGAAEHGRLDMTSHLLNLGADVKGRSNKSYRMAICRAWKEGHRVLANMIQDWKRDHYGEDDVDTIENIVASVTDGEL